MKIQFTIEFRDQSENDDGVVILTKNENGTISIALSLKQNGDIQCTLPAEKASELNSSLTELTQT